MRTAYRFKLESWERPRFSGCRCLYTSCHGQQAHGAKRQPLAWGYAAHHAPPALFSSPARPSGRRTAASKESLDASHLFASRRCGVMFATRREACDESGAPAVGVQTAEHGLQQARVGPTGR
jgi:hypothetical protein